jgi:5-methylcytosine-specific restriction endonuclease McrA
VTEVPIAELEFLRKLQRLLNEGDFVSTYKLALLNALADLSLEGTLADDGSLRLPVRAIAEKFIEYYWRQSLPYRALDGRGIALRQNTGKQASIVSMLAKRQAVHPTVAVMRAADGWDALVSEVADTVSKMPLWKLQTVGSETDPFLYRKSEYSAGSIRLLPGVPAAFRALYGLVLDAVRGAWIRQINAIGANRAVLGDRDLAIFLFGSDRGTLAGFTRVLRAHQASLCLYCHRAIKGIGDVDHFIAWSRYPADLGFNLVLSHDVCNTRKRDFLAHPKHLESWYRSHIERAKELAQRFDAAKLPHDKERTRAVVWWAYEQGEMAGAHAWLREKEFERLDARWRNALRPEELAQVAEPKSPPYLHA